MFRFFKLFKPFKLFARVTEVTRDPHPHLRHQIECHPYEKPRGCGDAWHVNPLVRLVEIVATRADHHRRNPGFLREEIHVPESGKTPFRSMTCLCLVGAGQRQSHRMLRIGLPWWVVRWVDSDLEPR